MTMGVLICGYLCMFAGMDMENGTAPPKLPQERD
jgi:hypothetical protein